MHTEFLIESLGIESIASAYQHDISAFASIKFYHFKFLRRVYEITELTLFENRVLAYYPHHYHFFVSFDPVSRP